MYQEEELRQHSLTKTRLRSNLIIAYKFQKNIQKCSDSLFSAVTNGKRGNSQVGHQEKLHKGLSVTVEEVAHG